MSQRVFCPTCQTTYAYSPAIRGRTFKCTHCGESFAAMPLEEATALPISPAADSAGMPPPLPAASTWKSRTLGPRPRWESGRTASPRESGAAAIFGLLAFFAVGFSIIGTGIGYLFWPSSKTPAPAPTQSAAPPEAPPADVEQPKSLQDILGDQAPQRGAIGRPDPNMNLQPPIQPLPPPKIGRQQ